MVVATALAAIDAALLISCALYAAVHQPAIAEQSHPVQFMYKPVDRPVIESMPLVWESRATGISKFYFDGVYYELDDLPKEYVDYAAWYVRLP